MSNILVTKAKSILTILLLVFLAGSIVFMVVKETVKQPISTDLTITDQENHPTNTSESQTNVSCVSVYYFHRNIRCKTCQTIEAYTKEAIESAFPDALNDQALRWHVVNLDEPENSHFVQDFELSLSTVILERNVNGIQKEWKNLQLVWEIVHDDKDKFLKYIQDETRAYLQDLEN